MVFVVAAGSATNKVFSSETDGTLGGAAIGGLVGSALGSVGTLVGGAIGGLIGNKIGEKNSQENALASTPYLPIYSNGNSTTSSGLGLSSDYSSALTGMTSSGIYNYDSSSSNISNLLSSGSTDVNSYISNLTGSSTSSQAQIMQLSTQMMSNYLNNYGSSLSGIISLYGGTDGLMQMYTTQSSQYLQGMNSILESSK